MRLDENFYSMKATEAAPMLLGKLLCRKMPDGTILKLPICETECYFGENDTACHASKGGKTKRTWPLYEKGGIAYIYLCYGIHSLLNIVTGEKDFPQAVLIRGAGDYNGPGKLTRALNIDRSLNSENLILSDVLWIEDAGYTPKVEATPRIGIDYATEEYRNILWRFIIKK